MCKISLMNSIKSFFDCSLAFDSMNTNFTYSDLVSRIYISPFYYSEARLKGNLDIPETCV
jgi:hypothetical protein